MLSDIQFDHPNNHRGRAFVIAEAGVNHNGSLDLALNMVDEAAAAGADAVKFQTFHTEALSTKALARAPYQRRAGNSPHYDMLKGLELDEEAHSALKERCIEVGIEFMSTAYDEVSVNFLVELGIKRLKIASADIIHRPLLEAAAESRLPVIISTGMANFSEVERALVVLRSRLDSDITLMHCVSSYPLAPAQVNMQWMLSLRSAFRLPTGYSDHTMGIEMPIMAVTLGAEVIEKHFTLSRTMDGPDHAASLEPSELANMIAAIRNVELANGSAPFGRADQEMENLSTMRRSLHAIRPVSAGQIIAREDLGVLRPADGLDPWLIHEVVGSRASIDLTPDDPVTWANVEFPDTGANDK